MVGARSCSAGVCRAEDALYSLHEKILVLGCVRGWEIDRKILQRADEIGKAARWKAEATKEDARGVCAWGGEQLELIDHARVFVHPLANPTYIQCSIGAA
jgi:hypothetical protein